MALDDKKQPIVVKKIKKGGHGHHGGAWKVAYADFVTAMMAFFLLMWLLGSTTQPQREGIAKYFKNPSAIQGPGGASTSMIKLGGAMEVPRSKGQPLQQSKAPQQPVESQLDKARLDKLMQELKKQIESSPTLKDFKDQLLLDITSEGLRIQIVDKKNRPMFDLGSTQLKSYTREILDELTKTINTVPNHISITGHTDATPYGRADYSNWELSADRANAARREMVRAGMPITKIGRVVGLANSVPFDKKNPFDPVNRRISIVVLNQATERAIGLDEGAPVAGDSSPSPQAATSAVPAPVMPVPPTAVQTPPPLIRPVKPPLPSVTSKPPVPPGASAPRGNSVQNAIENVLGPPPAKK